VSFTEISHRARSNLTEAHLLSPSVSGPSNRSEIRSSADRPEQLPAVATGSTSMHTTPTHCMMEWGKCELSSWDRSGSLYPSTPSPHKFHPFPPGKLLAFASNFTLLIMLPPMQCKWWSSPLHHHSTSLLIALIFPTPTTSGSHGEQNTQGISLWFPSPTKKKMPPLGPFCFSSMPGSNADRNAYHSRF
jgi:hypothetical protein